MTIEFLGFMLGTIVFDQIAAKQSAIDEAKALCGSKGIVNLGSGYGRTSQGNEICRLPQVLANVDMTDNAECPKLIIADLEQPLPFGDKQFGVSFASHILEHLENWQLAISEWQRIADYTVVVIPIPIDPFNIFHPGHKQYFTNIDQLKESYPEVRFYW